MGIQAICNGTNPNPMCVDVQTSSINGLQMKEHGSLGDEYAPKVRKPYTITKQRERWTEEEHNKFLEALQLYGRSWRRIEEHIGTKTAVQIRSHAQKFFSKVVRESKPIEIPPPRPKRKPVHPYPRKMGNPLINGGITIGNLGRSSSQLQSSAEQENGSPTSVLSAFGSDTMNPFLLNMKNRCTSPVTSGVGSNEQDSSTEETEQKQIQSATDASVPCLRLFGKTVMVTYAQKPSSPSVGSKSISPIDVERQDKISNVHMGSSALPILPMFCPIPSIYSNSMNHPWMFLCGNLSLPFLHQQNSNSRHVVSQPCVEIPSDKATQNECSWAGSNIANEGGHMVSSKCTKRARSVDNGEHVGFVPYKRYVVGRDDEQHSQSVNDDGQDQSIGLCL